MGNFQKQIKQEYAKYSLIIEYEENSKGDLVFSLRLMSGDLEIASESYRGMNNNTPLGAIYNQIVQLENTESDKCLNCKYKVGDYTGDIGYLLYLAFKSRIRLKFVKFKFYFFKFFRNMFRPKDKPSRIK